VNRVLGSGTRLLLDQLLKARALRLGIEAREIPSRVLGYDFEVKTHHEVAKGILEDRGDVGLTPEIRRREVCFSLYTCLLGEL